MRDLTEDRYNLARRAPVMKTALAELNEMDNADLKLAKDIVEGVAPIPEEVDEATRLYIQEIQSLAKMNTRSYEDKFVMTGNQFSSFWKSANENTQSSVSGHHYGFYKAGAKSRYVSDAHALQLTLVGRSGVPIPRWTYTLQLLLSKGKGLSTVSNNRILNLYEADFNQYKSFVVGWMAMMALHDTKGLPSEHFSKRGSTAIDAKFDTTLMVDICRQSRLPMILGSVDAAQCYDRVLHLWVLLMLIALLKNFVLAFVMLFTLQNMRFFVRSGYGDSSVSHGGLDTVWAWMGLGQGSRGAPDCWLLISSPMFNILRREKMCAEVENPLTGEKTESVGCAFVDDANMYVFSKRLDTVQKVYDEAVEHIASWSRLLRVTGGCAKSEKSFWYLLNQKFVKGEWVWEST